MLETGSTNADLLARIASGERADGDWLVAARQTAGRGRLGRSWSSQAGNFHGSTIVALQDDDAPAPTLALVAGIALHRAVEEIAGGRAEIRLKWPNDLMIGAAKLAGILLERSGEWVILGFGVNLAFAPSLPQRPTVALQNIGVEMTPKQFAPVLAAKVADEMVRWREVSISSTADRWQERAHPTGTRLVIGDGTDAGLTGAYDGLDASGALRLRLEDGTRRTVMAGDIHFADAI